MGRLNFEFREQKPGGLRRRWLANTITVMSALGLVCVLAVTASFAAFYYSNMESDLRELAHNRASFIQEFQDREDGHFYRFCLDYVRTTEKGSSVQLQFVDVNGTVAASGDPQQEGMDPGTTDIREAVNTRGTTTDVGEDASLGYRVIAVSSPIIYTSGEVAGVLRHAVDTRAVDRQIMNVAFISLFSLLMVLTVVVVSNTLFIRSVMGPVTQINEKARRIANGSYGVQIKTRYNDEIGELAETINELSAKIAQNEKIQAEFISQLSHELRTPLTVINGWSETLLADENMDNDTRQGMKIISREALRLTEMVVELLDFTRMQDGRMTLNVEPTDIRSEFEDTVYMYGARLAQEGIRLECLYNEDDIPEIPCDGQRLRQVFLNILDNAAKHGGAGQRIEAEMAFEDNQVVVRIRDFGPGIPEDEIPLVKKKFYKGSSSVRGTGIGLAVCDEIVEMHGGTLTLENAEGGGTLVTVILPAAQ